jgi:U32 family peptidase
MKKIKKPELLAPAGNLAKLKMAFAHGADAIYCGTPDFSLRTRINDFSLEDIKEGINYAHKLGKKAYVTLNILAHEPHLKALAKHVGELKEMSPDALFIADPGVARIVQKKWPQAKLSLSTQANCTNSESALFWAKQGFKRLILSRELSLEEIKAIKKKLGKTEIEVFVHGALCSAYSGRCFLSSYFTGRNANLGDCVQPCRWEYEIKPLGHEKSLVIGADSHGTYLLNSQDLCLIERLPEIINAGVSALKIEGRAKSVYYLANVIGAYRRGIDLVCSGAKKNEIKKELAFLKKELLAKLQHRGYTEGFMFADSDNLQNHQGNFPNSNWEFCGEVIACHKNKAVYDLTVRVHNTLLADDKLEIVAPGYNVSAFSAKTMRDEKNEKIKEAHGGGGNQQVIISSQKAYTVFSVLRRKIK